MTRGFWSRGGGSLLRYKLPKALDIPYDMSGTGVAYSLGIQSGMPRTDMGYGLDTQAEMNRTDASVPRRDVWY
eukprot:2365250-Rhodomonas_salina.2